MTASAGFRVNSPKVGHEVFDAEVVIINLGTGTYYSMDGVAADIWTRIDGAMPGEIVEGLTARYEASAGDIETAVAQFLDELQREGLIVPDQASSDEKERPGRSAEGREHPLPRFEPPVLHKYSDMQDLLLLDPIHDVDDAGWPILKSNDDAR